jgi:hypothetical protein
MPAAACARGGSCGLGFREEGLTEGVWSPARLGIGGGEDQQEVGVQVIRMHSCRSRGDAEAVETNSGRGWRWRPL